MALNKTATILLALILVISCNNNSKNSEKLKQTDSQLELFKIINFQDERNGDSLLPYFYSTNKLLKNKAVLAFASIINKKYEEDLINLYNIDSLTEIKKACIYALGQLRDSSTTNKLIHLHKNNNREVLNQVFLEAIGKGCTKSHLNYFINSNYSSKDLSFGILRAAYRTKEYQSFDIQIKEFVKSKDEETRRNGILLLTRLMGPVSELTTNEIMYVQTILNKEEDEYLYDYLKYYLTLNKTPSYIYEKDGVKEISKYSNDPYKYADNLSHLMVQSYEGLDYLLNLAISDKETIIKTEAANCLIKNLASDKLVINKKPKSHYLNKLLETKDMALVSIATYGIKNPLIIKKDEAKLVFEEQLNNLSSLYSKLSQKETYIDLKKTLAYLRDESYIAETIEFNHPIDSAYLKYVKSNQNVKITTSKGEIIILCNKDFAPASVCNFLKLVDQGYYDGKVFHRVVPQFVIQTGCNRGDGWGAPEWTQRSEFSNYLSYYPGAVGLASSGNDTEGFQWFITHTYTPFLDGRYTIFAYVTEGMGVVKKIKKGDKIISIRRMP